MSEVANFNVKKQSTSFLVADELMLESKPDITGGGRRRVDKLMKLWGYGAKELGFDGEVHAPPVSVTGEVFVRKYEMREIIFLNGVEEEAAPPGVMRASELEL